MKMPRGELLPYELVWELAKLWYKDRLSPGFKGRSLAEARQIFVQLGLVNQFWQVDVSS
jgi:hypothetical protein